jgi:glycerate 2-kinase
VVARGAVLSRVAPDPLDRILAAALAAVEPAAATARALDRYRQVIDLPERTWIAAAGKAAAGMAVAALERLGESVAGGTVAVPGGAAAAALPGLTVWQAGHPAPTAHSLAAGSEALRVARGAGPGDLVLCLLSGGASSMWAAPPPEVSLTALAATTGALLRAGVPIEEINTVRRHLSRIGGGGLARAAWPARIATLAISDVIGAPLDAIGSGPAVADPSTFGQALAIAHAVPEVPASVIAYLQAGAAGAHPESARADEPCFEGSSAFVIADNRDALAGAAAEAERLGYRAEVVAEPLSGEARQSALMIAGMVRARLHDPPRALVLGGETTVTVRGGGAGGRCQELALALAAELRGVDGWRAAAFGTDGVDGPTPAAGARIDGATAHSGEVAAALADNDSYGFFRKNGGLIVTGPTGTNVADVVVVLLGEVQP